MCPTTTGHGVSSGCPRTWHMEPTLSHRLPKSALNLCTFVVTGKRSRNVRIRMRAGHGTGDFPSSAASRCQDGRLWSGSGPDDDCIDDDAGSAAGRSSGSGFWHGSGFSVRIRSQEANRNRRRKTIPHSSQTHPPLPILAVILQLNRFQPLRLTTPQMVSFLRRRLSSSMTKPLDPSAMGDRQQYFYVRPMSFVCSSFGWARAVCLYLAIYL